MNQYELTEFPKEVIDEIQNYVYRLIDPRNGETFYVGKGKGNRVFQHMKCAISADEKDDLNDRILTIREIISAGLDVIHVIHRHGMTEENAIEVEAALIDAYPGATNLQGGNGSIDYGPMNAIEIINKYAAEEAKFEHKVMMITINKSISERSIYDATKFAWKIDKNRAVKADYILSVKQGIIVGVFKASEWKEATEKNFPEFHVDISGRFGFIGVEADESVKKKYLMKRIPNSFRKKGASNPIKYSF